MAGDQDPHGVAAFGTSEVGSFDFGSGFQDDVQDELEKAQGFLGAPIDQQGHVFPAVAVIVLSTLATVAALEQVLFRAKLSADPVDQVLFHGYFTLLVALTQQSDRAGSFSQGLDVG